MLQKVRHGPIRLTYFIDIWVTSRVNEATIYFAPCECFNFQFNERDQAARLASDWEAVGMLVDRFCFWVYLILIVVTGMITLIPPMPYVYERALNDEALIQRFKELANHVDPMDYA